MDYSSIAEAQLWCMVTTSSEHNDSRIPASHPFLRSIRLFFSPAKALKWHPDKNRDDPKKAEERFKVVSEAYEVHTIAHLTIPDSRSIFR